MGYMKYFMQEPSIWGVKYYGNKIPYNLVLLPEEGSEIEHCFRITIA